MTRRGSRGPGRLRRLAFRLTLRLYPAAFRERHGPELDATFEEMWRDRGSMAGAVALWTRLIVDGVGNGTRARLSERRATSQHTDERRREPMLKALWNDIARDVRLALRGTARQSSTAAAVVTTLALGLGAAAAIFSVVDALLLRPLPYAEPERLVELRRTYPFGGILSHFDAAHAREITAQLDVAESIAAHARRDMVLTNAGDPRTVRTHAVSANFFTTLGRTTAQGRAFDAQESAAGERLAVLSHEFWRSLGGGADVIGRSLELDEARYEVIGVMPPDFRYPTRYGGEVFLPLDANYHAAGLPQSSVSLIARLRAGVEIDAASARLAAIIHDVLGAGAEDVGWTPEASFVGEHRGNPNGRTAIWLVAGSVAAMLLIALLNATNLMLTRVSVRAREFAVRHSLGASAGRLRAQLMVECLVLAIAAGGAAVLLALSGVRLLLAIAPAELTDLAVNRIAIDGRVLLFTFGVTVAAGFVLGLLPALAAARSARQQIGAALSAYAGTRRERHRVRSALVVAQVALAMTLLAGASLLMTSFVRLMQVDTGFDLDRIALVSIFPNERAYPDAERRRTFAEEVETRIAALPGVAAVSRSDGLPPGSSFWVRPQLQAEHDAEPRADSPLLLPFANVPPEFAETLELRFSAGRNFGADETPASNVAIIDADLASFLWGVRPAVGRRFRTGDDAPWLTVVGVVDELMMGLPDGSIGDFVVLRPAPATLSDRAAFFAVRTSGPASAALPAIRAAVREVDANQPVAELWTGRSAVADALHHQRFFTLLMAVLSTLSMILAAIGLYSLLSFAVARRTKEMGIRMAIGARAASLLRLVIGRGVRLAALGIVLGLAGSLAAARFIRSLLFQVEPGAPLPLAVVAALMLTIAVAACAGPALRAARLDPASILRAD